MSDKAKGILIKLIEEYGGTYQSYKVNEALKSLCEIILEQLPEEGEHWKEHYIGDKKFAQGYNLCLSEVHKVLKEIFEIGGE